MYTLILLTSNEGYRVLTFSMEEQARNALQQHLAEVVGTTIAAVYDPFGQIVHKVW